MKKISMIGVASGVAANVLGSEQGPEVVAHSANRALLKKEVQCQWDETLEPIMVPDKMDIVANLCSRLAKKTWKYTQQKQLFAVIGGDHSCAAGTWSGVSAALPAHESLGLIWVDAHLDAHTPETSHTGNIHGMPLASLLGYGDPRMTQLLNPHPKILPEHLCVLGARSFESEERDLLKRLNVRLYDMSEIRARGFNKIFHDVMIYLSSACHKYGVSVDLDAVDPSEAPGVSAPVKGGISAAALCSALCTLRGDTQFVGLEIAEFNPQHDQDQKTERLIFNILSSCFSEE